MTITCQSEISPGSDSIADLAHDIERLGTQAIATATAGNVLRVAMEDAIRDLQTALARLQFALQEAARVLGP